MSPRFQWLGAAGVVLLLSILQLRGDITLPAAPPPQADAQAAVVLRGDLIIIPLRGHHSGSGTVTFWIVERPEHGTLSELRLLGDNRATIVYKHDGTDSSPGDRFTYAVKTSGDRVSTPAEVRIAVQEPPARLQMPARMAFEDITAGERQTRQLTITNSGGGILAGRLTVSAPWMLAEASYRVPGGKSKKIAITFLPNEGRNYVGQITLAGEDGSQAAIALEGSATSPISLQPEHLQIAPQQEESQRRAGSFSLTNQTDQSLELTFESSRDVEPIAAATLKPRETRTISVILLPPGTLPVRDEVRVKGDGFMARLMVESEAMVAKHGVSAPATPAPLASSATPPVSSTPWPSLSPPLNAPPPDDAAALSRASTGMRVVPVHVVRLDYSGWELSWVAPKSPVATYRIEERELSLDAAGELQTSWRPLTTPAIARSADSTSVQLKNLPADRLHMVKVTALKVDGLALWESPLVPLSPPKATEHGGRFWLLLLGTVLAALIVWRWRLERCG